MDDEWVDYEVASNLLGVTARTIRGYVESGIIRKRNDIQKKKSYFLLRDINDVMAAKRGDGLDQRSFKVRYLLARIDRLERMVTILSQQSGGDTLFPSLDETHDIAKQYYLEAKKHLGHTQFPLGLVKQWVRVFFAIRSKHFELMSKWMDDPHPWKVMTDLADLLLKYISSAEEYDYELWLQLLHDQLLRSREALRSEAVLFETGNDREVPAFTRDSEDDLIEWSQST